MNKTELVYCSETSLKKMIKEKEKEIEALKNELVKIYSKKSEKRSDRYQKQKELNRRRGDWAKQNLEVGDVIKVTGSNIKSDRVVKILKPSCVVVETVRWDRKENKYVPSIHAITDHGFDKVTHVFRNGKMTNIKDYLG